LNKPLSGPVAPTAGDALLCPAAAPNRAALQVCRPRLGAVHDHHDPFEGRPASRPIPPCFRPVFFADFAFV